MKHVLAVSVLCGIFALGFLWYVSVPQSTVAAGTVIVNERDTDVWLLGPNESYATAYTFVSGIQSIGQGSLLAGPITNSNFNNIPDNDPGNDMFIARLPLVDTTLDNFGSFSFDYQLGNDTTTSDQVALRVWTGATVDTFECAYTYEASLGDASKFRKFNFSTQLGPELVISNGQGGVSCPSTLDQMSTSTQIAGLDILLGDTTTSDTGAAVYLDNVELIVDGVATNFNFEGLPVDKSQCQKGGWETYNFKNQGECMQTVNKK